MNKHFKFLITSCFVGIWPNQSEIFYGQTFYFLYGCYGHLGSDIKTLQSLDSQLNNLPTILDTLLLQIYLGLLFSNLKVFAILDFVKTFCSPYSLSLL